MKKYRKKPIVVTAEQVTESTAIVTLEGTMVAQPGDYVVTGVRGERWPVRKDIFEETYEEVL